MFPLLVWVSLLNFPIIQIETCIDTHQSIPWHFCFIALSHKQQFEHLCYTSGVGGYYTKFYMGGSISRSIYICTILIEKAPLLQIFIAKGYMYPFTSLFKNTASLLYSLGNKLDNVAESPHEFWLKRVNENFSTTFQNQKNGIPKSQIYLPFHTP